MNIRVQVFRSAQRALAGPNERAKFSKHRSSFVSRLIKVARSLGGPTVFYVEKCPPRPEAILRGIEMIQEMIRKGIRTDDPLVIDEKTKIKQVLKTYDE